MVPPSNEGTTTTLALPVLRRGELVEPERVRSVRPTLVGVLAPIDGPDEARAIVQALRSALDVGRADDPTAVDALLMVLLAKGVDETTGDRLRFAVDPRERDRSAQKHLNMLLDRATEWLQWATHEPDWPRIAVSPATASSCLETLARCSLMLTAAEPGGEATLRALFDEVVSGSGRLPAASAFVREEPHLQLLDRLGFKTRSSRLRTVVVAAAKAFGTLGSVKDRNLDWMRGNYKKGDLQLTNFPKLIHVELSTHCNLACRTCSITRPGRKRELTYLQLDTLERLRPALPFISDCKLHGGGEPFMHPQIERVLEIFREEGVRLNTVTNAVLIRERLGRLIGETFSSLTVSVDGADKQTYEDVRLKSSWERLLRGIDNVNAHRNPELRLIIGVVMLKCNIHQLPDLVRFAHEHQAQELQAAWLVPFHDLPWTQTQELTGDPVRTNHFMDEARAVGDELGISVRIPDNLPVGDQPNGDEPTTGANGRTRPANRSERGADRAGGEASTIVALDHEATYWNLHGTDKVEGHCRLMYDRAMILVDGNVKPCGQSRYVPELGSIHDRSFEQCWNGVGYQNLRATFNSGTLPRTCRSCNFIRSKQLGTARLVY